MPASVPVGGATGVLYARRSADGMFTHLLIVRRTFANAEAFQFEGLKQGNYV